MAAAAARSRRKRTQRRYGAMTTMNVRPRSNVPNGRTSFDHSSAVVQSHSTRSIART
jgi:hypothetical protein